jgi:hypothetical protein
MKAMPNMGADSTAGGVMKGMGGMK